MHELGHQITQMILVEHLDIWVYNIFINIPDLDSKEYIDLKNTLSIIIRYLTLLNKNISIDDIKIIEPDLEEKEDDTQPTIKDKENAKYYLLF